MIPLYRTLVILVLALYLPRFGLAVDLSYYLPTDTDYDASVPQPASVLGYEVGEWHARHDQIVQYLELLAKASPRLRVEDYGKTHEGRRLLLATVSSPTNLRRLESIRERHLAALDAGRSAPAEKDRPVVVWLGYSVHGNEPSGANAALVVAYHLAAARGPRIDELLRGTVILIDPALNPDGLSRFATWANSHRGSNLVADPAHREHREAWPGGRTNHYWFDLNRDWTLLTHPESRGRLERFQAWKPNVVADVHEMGTNRTYFFQPGIPSRQNPLTPARNLELTRRVAGYHARALDRIGSLYYTEESFDDFYFGKGSTYPDANGGVGILFEQATSRGHLQESSFGLLSFPFTIRNQFRTSLSTLEAALDLRPDLLDYQREFYLSASTEASRDRLRAYVFQSPEDPARTFRLVDLLLRHGIHVHRLARRYESGGEEFDEGHGFIVPLSQPQYRLARSLLERRTEFEDNSFYDVSTWTLPLSFGLSYAEVAATDFDSGLIGERVMEAEKPRGRFVRCKEPVAHVFSWRSYDAPRAVQRLLDADVRVRAATRPFEVDLGREIHEFAPGTIVVATGIQEKSAREMRSLFQRIAAEDGVDVHALSTGLTVRGIDLGSPMVLEVKKPKIAMLVGTGVSGYEAGEVWHLLDQRYGLGITLVERSRFASLDLARYSHLVLVSGAYDPISSGTVDRMRRWVEAGGVLISCRGSIGWVERSVLRRADSGEKRPDGPGAERASAAPEQPSEIPQPLPYADYERLRAERQISGAIFRTELDLTHPLCFGYSNSTLPVFRNSTRVLEVERDPFATPVRYSQEPLLSGYASPENLEKIRSSAVVCANRLGRGVVIRIVDNLNFRGVWYGTNKIFANAIYFGGLIQATGPLEPSE